jgi:hypothetical protein
LYSNSLVFNKIEKKGIQISVINVPIEKKDTTNPVLARSISLEGINLCRKTPTPHHAAQPERLNNGRSFFAPKKCVIKLECNRNCSINISVHRRFQFQLTKTDAPVLSFITNPGLRSLRSLTPGYKYIAPTGHGPQKQIVIVNYKMICPCKQPNEDAINPVLTRSISLEGINICRKTPPPHHEAQPER